MILEGSPRPEVVYIAGCGRSGSTLLDVALGNHPSMFGAGELSSLFAEWSSGGRCSCGEGYGQCVVWGPVLRQVQSEFPSLQAAEAERITRRVESLKGGLGSPFAAGVSGREEYARLWLSVLGAVTDVTGRKVVVDSSKSSRPVAHRFLTLANLVGAEVRILHLVRDPRALLWSALRGSNRPQGAGGRRSFRGGLFRALAGWGMANARVHASRVSRLGWPIFRLRYEDLVADPVRALSEVADFLRLDLSPVIARVRDQRPFDPGHGVSGNRMRRQGPVRIVPHEEWRQGLPAYARRIAVLTWPLARLYGYDVLHRGALLGLPEASPG